jgi:hypothetical protein
MSQNVSGGGPAEGAAPPTRVDHPFVWPEGREWDRCVICRLGEAAHLRRADVEEAPLIRVAAETTPERLLEDYHKVAWARDRYVKGNGHARESDGGYWGLLRARGMR